uniref:Uncharacterized protein n=1 Tax=Solanum lycopersicum TaxID=4081 RepID=A0A3Q7I203_SOLLC
MLVPNERNEFVLLRHKLNALIEKDKFPMPFMDHMLDNLVETGYNKISIAPEDKGKINNIHLMIWDLRLQKHAIWVVQCFSDLRMVYDVTFLRY